MKLLALLVALAVTLTAAPVLADAVLADGNMATSNQEADSDQEFVVGTVGEVSAEPEGTVLDGDSPQPSRQPAPAAQPARDKTPYYQTRDGHDETSKRVLRGDFAPRRHAHPARPSRPASTRTVYQERVVERQVPAPAQKPVVINNFTTPPAEPAKPRTPTPGEEQRAMIGWVILGLAVAGGVAIAIYAIASSSGVRRQEEASRQAQAAQLATALANQAPFSPAAGREVSINASIFPNGGGVVRANARDALQPPQIVAVPAPPAPPVAPAAMPPGAAAVLTLDGLQQLTNLQVQVQPPAQPVQQPAQ